MAQFYSNHYFGDWFLVCPQCDNKPDCILKWESGHSQCKICKRSIKMTNGINTNCIHAQKCSKCRTSYICRRFRN